MDEEGMAEMVWDEEGVAEMIWDEEKVAEMPWMKKGLLRWYGMKPREDRGIGIGERGGGALLYSALERDCKQARGPRHEVRHVTNSPIFATHWKDIFSMHFQ
jgi:hypothetical protein